MGRLGKLSFISNLFVDEEIKYLQSMGYPNNIIKYFKNLKKHHINPKFVNEINPIEDVKVENEDAIPGLMVVPMGYLNLATTSDGDAFCVDINNNYSIVLVGHDLCEEGEKPEQMAKGIVKVAETFEEFIDKFHKGELPESFWDIAPPEAYSKHSIE